MASGSNPVVDFGSDDGRGLSGAEVDVELEFIAQGWDLRDSVNAAYAPKVLSCEAQDGYDARGRIERLFQFKRCGHDFNSLSVKFRGPDNQ